MLQKEVLWFFGSVFLLAIGYRMNEAFLTISLKGMNAGDEVVGWALLASALSEIPIFFLLSRYGDKFKELPLLAFCQPDVHAALSVHVACAGTGYRSCHSGHAQHFIRYLLCNCGPLHHSDHP
ncbi:MFS transporter [Paenibacillus rhizoplanae]